MEELIKRKQQLESALERKVGRQSVANKEERLQVYREAAPLSRELRKLDGIIARQRAGLLEILHHAFVEIHSLIDRNEIEQARDLATVFQSISREVCNENGFAWSQLKESVRAYQEKYHLKEYSAKTDYLTM